MTVPGYNGPASAFLHRDLAYRDPLELPHVTFGDLLRSKDSVWIEREAGPYPTAPVHPAFYDRTPDGITDLVVELPPVRPAAFIMALDDVLLTGSRGLVTADGHYSFDESFPDEDQIDRNTSMLGSPEIFLNQWMGFANTGRRGVYQLHASKPVVEIDEPVMLLTSAEGPNFGAFIYRMLPKIAALRLLDSGLKILIPQYHASFAQFLVAAGVNPGNLIHHDLDAWYRLKRVYVPSVRNRDVWFDEKSVALFDEMRMLNGSPRSNRKIYLSRKAVEGNPRKMVNEPELIEALTKRGFDIVLPEQLTATEQIKAFSSAGTIVAAAGSAIYNSAFCYPGTRFIDIESEPHWIRGHVRIFGSSSLHYGIFEGRALDTSGRPHVPFEVDVPRFMARLDNFSGAHAPYPVLAASN
jgi:capsular polysaccharide biosynthesis protein